jgi:rhamnogalacturonyl hydrolase YesR
MKNISIKLFAYMLISFFIFSCSDEKGSESPITDDVSKTINPVSNLTAKATELEKEINLGWTNPTDEDLLKIEISYQAKNKTAKSSANPILMNAVKGKEESLNISVPEYTTYTISVVTINKAGIRSATKTADAKPLEPGEEQILPPVFQARTDTMMRAMINLFLGGPRDVWNSSYPKATGPYWDGDAVIWGQGGGFSGYVATREATIGTPLEDYYKNLEARMVNGINKFITVEDGISAYAVYPASGNQRFYDDNAWVGLDMINLYSLTGNNDYLQKAIMVWEYLGKGTDSYANGGIYWREIPASTSKHTCSTAPGAVLAAKLYIATQENKYLQNAIDLYAWLKNTLQDPADYLFWDNASEDNGQIVIEKNKYSYNSGQPMQAAVLLYNITNDETYLTDARNIAKSAYRRWFKDFYSGALEERIRIISDGGDAGTWFNAILFRGFIELYKAELAKSENGDRTYITAYEKTMSHAWLSNCRQKNTNLLNNDFTGSSGQTSWGILSQGASVEMLARLASFERDGQ